ncbi:hypothetical protein K3165_03825 [Qipengyuania sp. 1XM1-15A]|uniref:hypothetical protein n=1 Tax=Qipengyuania xiamenensis TaxID=2867237 RepID=UPI001C86B63A|nr:hypothetical protein [Qipengyuania xiamenensis]MBX7532051.1 hypothetical protein [Qipengyuania xiamenensis]
MPVQLNQPGQLASFPLTSPPKGYELESHEWIASEINFTDRKVGITYPFPDMIDLVAPVSEHTLCFPDQSWKSPLEKAHQLDQELKEHLKAFPAIDGIKLTRCWPPHSPAKAIIQFEFAGVHLGLVELWRTNIDQFPSWSLRLEFNPRQLGMDGMNRLSHLFELAFGMLSLAGILKSSKVSRLDASVDVLGVQPIDLITRIKNAGKTGSYHSSSGALETKMFFGAKQPSANPLKTVGPLRLKIYDKVAEQEAKSKKPLFNSPRATRLECSRRWKSNRPSLAQILKIKNPFEGVEVAYSGRADLICTPVWRRTLERAIVYGIDNIPVEPPLAQSLKFISIYKTIQPDILSAKSWDDWSQGVALTGLTNWIKQTCEDDFSSLSFYFE